MIADREAVPRKERLVMRHVASAFCIALWAILSPAHAEDAKSCTVNAFGYAGQKETAADRLYLQITQKQCAKGDILIIVAELSSQLANVSTFAADFCDFSQQIVHEAERQGTRALIVCAYSGSRRSRR